MKIDFFSKINSAINYLEQGQIIAYPTETVWGLGVNALDENAILKLNTLKQRTKAFIILVSSKDELFNFIYEIFSW